MTKKTTTKKTAAPKATKTAKVAKQPKAKATKKHEGKLSALDAARITFEEDRKGSIAPGKLADLVVWAQDPLTAPLDALPDLTPDLTMIGGQIVHRAPTLT